MNLKTNPELLPLIEWWEKDGKQTVVWLLVAAIAVGGWYGWKNYRASVREASARAIATADTTEKMEAAIAKFSGSAAEGSLKIRLAKSYFDAGRFEEALAQYESLIGNAPDGFADVPVVGRAQCLEALGKFAEGAEAFDAFVEANPTNYLTLTARLGAVRCLAQAGDEKAALARLDALKEEVKGDDLSKARVEAAEKVVKRLGKQAAAPAPAVAPASTARLRPILRRLRRQNRSSAAEARS